MWMMSQGEEEEKKDNKMEMKLDSLASSVTISQMCIQSNNNYQIVCHYNRLCRLNTNK